LIFQEANHLLTRYLVVVKVVIGQLSFLAHRENDSGQKIYVGNGEHCPIAKWDNQKTTDTNNPTRKGRREARLEVDAAEPVGT